MIYLMVGKEVGPYRILEKIGQGGIGIVYKGIHMKLEQEVAIKVLSPELSQDPSMRERFIKEARIQAKLSHPNVVNILNYLEDNGNIFLVMEYVNGETLENQLKKEDRLPIKKAVSISLSVLEALDFMHSKGIIHRDIKPSNIMLTDSGLVKVTDFGLAKVMDEKGQTRTSMVGTLRYMSPEQILGEEIGVVSDIYSFGITFYHMVTGRTPFSGDSEYKIMKGHLEEKPLPLWEINSNVSRELGEIILKAVAKSLKDRYQNVKEFAKDLKTAIKKPEEARIQLQVPIKAKSLKIPLHPLHLDKRWFLILTSVLLIIISILVWPKAEFLLTVSSTSAPTVIGSIQSSLDLGFDNSFPKDVALEYILSKLEENTERKDITKEKQLSKVPVKKGKRSSSQLNINSSKLKMTNKHAITNKQVINEKKELENVLRRILLLPQP